MYLLKPGKDYSFKKLKKANKKAGRYFFSKDTMEYFETTLIEQPYTGWAYWIFVDQEKSIFNQKNYIYKIRISYVNGYVDTVPSHPNLTRGAAIMSAEHFAKMFAALDPNIQERVIKFYNEGKE